MQKKIYFPLGDFIFTLFFTIILSYIGGLTIFNDVYCVFLIYIAALSLTNLNKISIEKIDRKNSRKRNRYKRHINNAKSPIKSMPLEIAEIGKNYDYDVCFATIKFLLGLLVVMPLAIVSFIFQTQDTNFGTFTFYFYIDAFLVPLLILLWDAFTYKQSPMQALKKLFHSLFYKNEIIKPVCGLFSLLALIFLTGIAIFFTLQEFIMKEVNIILKIFFFVCGIVFLIYSFFGQK